MAQEFLNCPDVISPFNEMRGKGVPEGIMSCLTSQSPWFLILSVFVN
jgi:hypothetical protein